MVKIVLDDIRRVTHYARTQERQFVQYINQKIAQSCGGRCMCSRRSWMPCGSGTVNSRCYLSGAMRITSLAG